MPGATHRCDAVHCRPHLPPPFFYILSDLHRLSHSLYLHRHFRQWRRSPFLRSPNARRILSRRLICQRSAQSSLQQGTRCSLRADRCPTCATRRAPRQYRGHSSAMPGLYFLGLPWLHKWQSVTLLGAAEDAEYVANHIASIAGPLTLLAPPGRWWRRCRRNSSTVKGSVHGMWRSSVRKVQQSRQSRRRSHPKVRLARWGIHNLRRCRP